MIKVAFISYWGSSDAEDLLCYPHTWVGDRYAQPLRELKHLAAQHGIEMYGSNFGDFKQADMLFFWERPRVDDERFRWALQSGKPLILFLTEPSSTLPLNSDYHNKLLFDHIFCWQGEINSYTHRIRPIYFAFPKDVLLPDFNSRKFSVMIASIYTRDKDPGELYSKRAEAVRWFENNHPDELDFYGRQNRFTDTKFSLYRGEVGEKLPILTQYKFQICYENSSSIQGYISEKIFDAFFAGCIPVYLGAEDVTDYIPENCFINRRNFDSYEALYDYMSSIDETKYLWYQANIREFLNTDFAHSYDEFALAKIILSTCFNI